MCAMIRQCDQVGKGAPMIPQRFEATRDFLRGDAQRLCHRVCRRVRHIIQWVWMCGAKGMHSIHTTDKAQRDVNKAVKCCPQGFASHIVTLTHKVAAVPVDGTWFLS